MLDVLFSEEARERVHLVLIAFCQAQKALTLCPRFTTRLFQGSCPLVCVTGQKAVKGGRLDNAILNEAGFSLLASSIWIGLDLSAACADSRSARGAELRWLL